MTDNFKRRFLKINVLLIRIKNNKVSEDMLAENFVEALNFS